MIALLWCAAQAQPGLQGWVESGVGARPDADGEPRLLLSEQLGFDLETEDGWGMAAQGGVRRTAVSDRLDRVDLLRLAIFRDQGGYALAGGRQVRLGPRGLMHLDGVSGELDPRRAVAASGWAGRLWHPETWQGGQTWVGGAQIHLRPLVAGETSRTTRFTAGAEARSGDGSESRAHVAASTWRPAGGTLAVDAEAAVPRDGDVPTHAAVQGTHPLGRHLTWGAEAAWEDLPPPTVPDAPPDPLGWLAPDGYGLARAWTSVTGGPVTVTLGGGPTWTPCPAEAALACSGAIARAGLATRIGAFTAGTSGLGAAVGGSRAAGLGAEFVAASRANVQAALVRLLPLDGAPATVWEVRLRSLLGVRIAQPDGGLELAAEVATGSDRVLNPWVRGGLTLRARLQGVPR